MLKATIEIHQRSQLSRATWYYETVVKYSCNVQLLL